MIDEIIMAVMEGLMDACKDERKAAGMQIMMDILCDYSEHEWCRMSEDERGEWIRSYLLEERKIKQ